MSGADADVLRQRLADLLDGGLVRQLRAISLTATSHQQRADEPLQRDGFGLIAKWLDDTIAQLHSSAVAVGLPGVSPEPTSNALDRVIARLSTLGWVATSLERQTADPYVQARLVRFVATLDHVMADLRCLSSDGTEGASATTVMSDIVDAAPDGVLLVDEAGRMLVVNPQVEKLFGYEWEELLGRPVEMLMPEGVRADHEGHRARYTADPSPRSMGMGLVLSGLRKDGTQFPLEISLSPLHVAEGIRTIATVRDISDRVEADQHLRQVELDLAVSEDRQRIAQDLHDRTIHRLFATGLAAQSVYSRTADPDLRPRVQHIITDLDATILDLRSTIFELASFAPSRSVRAQVHSVCADESPALGFAPSIRFVGPVETLDEALTPELVAVLREALSNVRRHAHASEVIVTAWVDDGLRLSIADDGVGMPPDHHLRGGNGLTDMTTRAKNLGGTFVVTPRAPCGTMVEWSVPLP